MSDESLRNLISNGKLANWMLGVDRYFSTGDRDFPCWPTDYSFLTSTIIFPELEREGFDASLIEGLFDFIKNNCDSPLGVRGSLSVMAALSGIYCGYSMEREDWRNVHKLAGSIILALSYVVIKVVGHRDGLLAINISQGDAAEWPEESAWSDITHSLNMIRFYLGDGVMQIYAINGFDYDDEYRYVVWKGLAAGG